MSIKYTTQVPNALMDIHLPELSLAEIKLLLIIIRQTNGWIDKYTGKRKKRDWITHRQFTSKTGLTRQTVSVTLDKLCQRGFIEITDFNNNKLNYPQERQGKTKLFYASSDLELVRLVNRTCKNREHQHVRLPVHNKTNSTKEKKTKEKRSNGLQSIRSVIRKLYDW